MTTSKRSASADPLHKQERDVRDVIIQYESFRYGMARLDECYSGASRGQPACCAVVGPSGCGKSQLAKYFRDKHPRQISEERDIVPVLYVELLPGVTVKQFADQILFDLGDPLYNHGTTLEKTLRIHFLFKECGVRVLLLDEVNHFVDNRSYAVAHEVADWLKSLIEHTQVSVVLFGLERSLELLRQNEQLRRRFSNPFSVGLLDWDDRGKTNPFLELLKEFQRELHAYDLSVLSDMNICYRCYCASSGLIGYLAKILGSATLAARRRGTRCVTVDLLARSYVDQIWEEDPRASNPFDLSIEPELKQRVKSVARRELVGKRRVSK